MCLVKVLKAAVDIKWDMTFWAFIWQFLNPLCFSECLDKHCTLLLCGKGDRKCRPDKLSGTPTGLSIVWWSQVAILTQLTISEQMLFWQKAACAQNKPVSQLNDSLAEVNTLVGIISCVKKMISFHNFRRDVIWLILYNFTHF